MGLATIDSHSQKEHTEIHKNPKFCVNQPSFTEIQGFNKLCKKFTKKCMEMRTNPDIFPDLSGFQYIILFANFLRF